MNDCGIKLLNHHHRHVVLVARISLTLSRHSSLSLIALGRSSGQHPISSHSCWMYVRAGRPAFARPCVGVHKSTSLISSSLLLQQCPACLVRLNKGWYDVKSSNQPFTCLSIHSSLYLYLCIYLPTSTCLWMPIILFMSLFISITLTDTI